MSTTAGIDLGSDSIRGIVLSKGRNGMPEVVAAGTVPVGDLGAMPESTDKTLALGEKLKELVRSARLKAGTRRIGAGGNAVSIRYLQVPPVPPWRMDMLVKYEVDEKSDATEPSTYDHRILDCPEVSGQYTVLIGICKETAAHALLTVGQSSGLGEVEVDLELLALYNAYYHGHGFDANKTVLVVDIGTNKINVLLCRNGSLYLLRTMLGGGQRFTQVIADELKIEAAEAEEFKRSQGEIVFDLAPAASTARSPRFSRTGGTAIMNRVPRLPGASGTGQPAVPPVTETSSPMMLELPKGLQKPPEAPKSDAPETTLELPPSLESDTPASETPSMPSIPNLEAPPSIAGGMGAPSGGTSEASVFGLSSLPLIEHAPAEPGADEKRKKQVSAVLVRETAALCAMLENTIMQCKQQTKMRDLKVERIYLTGGGSKLRGLHEFMNRRMRVDCMPLEPFKQLSLDRLPADQAAELKAEQHNMGVAVGLALSNLMPGAMSFLLWPESVKQRKTYWARGAYLHYSAALLALAMGLFIFTPFRNAQALSSNDKAATEAVKIGTSEALKLRDLMDENKEKQLRLKRIGSNISSGHYFLNLLAELKDKSRIGDDIYLTQVSTKIPAVLNKINDNAGGGTPAVANPKEKLPDKNATVEDTFQVERRVFIRGFARANDEMLLVETVTTFIKRLMPDTANPDNPANLFKDVRPLYLSPDKQKQGTWHLMEFVLEAYVEGTRETGKDEKKDDKTKPATGPKAGPQPKKVIQPGGAPVPNPGDKKQDF